MSRLPWAMVLIRHVAVCLVRSFYGTEAEFEAAQERLLEHWRR